MVLVKEGPLGIHFLKKGMLTKEGTYIMAIFGTGILNNYQIKQETLCTVNFNVRLQQHNPLMPNPQLRPTGASESHRGRRMNTYIWGYKGLKIDYIAILTIIA